METYIEIIVIILIICNLWLLAASRIKQCIYLVAFQGAMLGLLPFFQTGHGILPRTFIIVTGITLIKGFVFPILLTKALKDVKVKAEVEPLVSHSVSMIIGIFALIISLWLDERLQLPLTIESELIIPLSYFTIFVGLFLTVTRKKAITQVLGYITLENGIFAFGVSILSEHPWLVEMGILLDVFVAVFIMGIMVFYIEKEFDHIDADKLAHLRDWKIHKNKLFSWDIYHSEAEEESK